MKSTFSYLVTMFAVAYWIFRLCVCFMGSLQHEFIIQPYNNSIEIIILFLTIPAIIFILRRNVIITTLYFGMYVAYFGTVVYNNIIANSSDYMPMLLNGLGVVIPTLVFLDVLIHNAHYVPTNKKSDWYYDNEKYDREFDERADRNEYKIK